MVKHVMLYISMYGEVTLTVVIGYVVITPVDELNIVRQILFITQKVEVITNVEKKEPQWLFTQIGVYYGETI